MFQIDGGTQCCRPGQYDKTNGFLRHILSVTQNKIINLTHSFIHLSSFYPICSHVRAVSVNSALLVTSHWGNLFVCVCNPHGVVLYQSISWTENAYFSSSHSLEVPPNFITSRQLAGHLGAQGVEWCLRTRARECLHACTHAHLWVSSMLNKTQRISLRAGKKKKGMSDSMTETCGRVESSTV